MDTHLIRIPVEKSQPGDIFLMRIKKDPQHVGFLGCSASGQPTFIHSYLQAMGVVEHYLDEYWQDRIVAAYSLFG